jgi:hypothetical protein
MQKSNMSLTNFFNRPALLAGRSTLEVICQSDRITRLCMGQSANPGLTAIFTEPHPAVARLMQPTDREWEQTTDEA